MRQRGELLERPFAHMYEIGGMRRVHLRGHQNILKRILLRVGALNLGLLMRTLFGVGTPRGRQSRLAAFFCSFVVACTALRDLLGTAYTPISTSNLECRLTRVSQDMPNQICSHERFATGC